MKILSVCCCVIALTLICIQEEVSCQAFYPAYGGMPNCDGEDDDLGLILTVLLFAAKQRSNIGINRYYNGYNSPCGVCTKSCCNCGKQKTVPIPYPIPFPTNNAIIFRSKSSDSDDDDDDDNQDAMHASMESSVKSSRNATLTFKPVLVSESGEATDD